MPYHPPVLACAGCGTRVPAGRLAFRCPAARQDDDVDHVLVPQGAHEHAWPATNEPNPFLRYRTLLHAWRAATASGLTDAAFVASVARLDAAVCDVDGRGFLATPLAVHEELARAAGLAGGRLLVKDETGNVAGSHKARHLMGVMLALQAGAATVDADAPLAIASCGNAALAAAVVARAAGRRLDVFVPTWAEAPVVSRLHALGAHVVPCERRAGVAGDPCYHRFRDATADGAVPFCCQGSDNGLTIDGGSTLAWEMADALAGDALDRVFVQVGGGALASACAAGFAEAVRRGRLPRLPKLHAVQTRGGYPVVRAYDRLVTRIVSAQGGDVSQALADRLATAQRIARDPESVTTAMRYARTHRAEFMWPWEEEPRSLASGILDDETYDWAAVVEGMLTSGGYPVVIDEDTLRAAHAAAQRHTGIRVSYTGVAGLAGLMAAVGGDPDIRADSVAVLFTGVERGPA